jgi:hypothetical protein
MRADGLVQHQAARPVAAAFAGRKSPGIVSATQRRRPPTRLLRDLMQQNSGLDNSSLLIKLTAIKFALQLLERNQTGACRQLT